MKTIGILGGMSWESTSLYYRLINEGVKDRLGGLHSAPILLDSLDFAPLERLQSAGDWAAIGAILSEKAVKLQNAEAHGILIATNSMHEVADTVEGAVDVPFLHIADAVGETITNNGLNKVGLLGTSFTMERTFYTGRLKERFGIDALIPGSGDRELVHKVIYRELCQGVIDHSSKTEYLRIMEGLADEGAQAIVLGCTEIGLLVCEEDTDIPLYDTAHLHAEAAVEWMMGSNSV